MIFFAYKLAQTQTGQGTGGRRQLGPARWRVRLRRRHRAQAPRGALHPGGRRDLQLDGHGMLQREPSAHGRHVGRRARSGQCHLPTDHLWQVGDAAPAGNRQAHAAAGMPPPQAPARALTRTRRTRASRRIRVALHAAPTRCPTYHAHALLCRSHWTQKRLRGDTRLAPRLWRRWTTQRRATLPSTAMRG